MRFSKFMTAALLLVLSLSYISVQAQGVDRSSKHETEKARLLVHIIKQRLEAGHFSHKKIDDTVSEAAFGLYLKQLDPQKRILLLEDVSRLKKFSGLIDDQIISGNLELANTASAILIVRGAEVHKIVKGILAGKLDFTLKEYIETDAEKLEYCKTHEELKSRWEKIIKYDVLHQYLNQSEDQKAGGSDKKKPATSKQLTEEEKWKAAREKVLKVYNEYFSRMSEEKVSERYDRFFNAVTHAFDPHTEYMPPMNKEAFDISMRGSLEGIGATLRDDENRIKVVSIVPGSPAEKQGQLQPEDVILKVAEGAGIPVDLSGMRVNEAVRLIRGKKGTEVRLTVRKPDNSTIIIPIIRDVIQIEETFVKGFTLKDQETESSFGYIKIPSFYRDFEKTANGGAGRNSTDDVRAELDNFKKQNIKGLIIDVRNNGGGALTDAVKIAGLFIKTGPVVQVKNSDNTINTLSDSDPEVSYSGPVIILVNKVSASASEILAGALQNYGRGIVMGADHTHGKGTVQTVIDLNNPHIKIVEMFKPLGAIKLTIQKFYRINGDSTQYRGVVPDIILPDVMKHLKTGEQYLDYALPWDTVSPVTYTSWPKCGPTIQELRTKSLNRTKTDQKFIDMESEAARLGERQKKTEKSLNLNEVRREIEEAKKQDKETKMPGSHANTAGAAKTKEEKKEIMLKELYSDSYIKEAISIIKDIIIANPSCISPNLN